MRRGKGCPVPDTDGPSQAQAPTQATEPLSAAGAAKGTQVSAWAEQGLAEEEKG